MSMKVQTFMGKASLDGLQHMDDQINSWLHKNHIEPVHIKQSFGSERHHGGQEEPVVVVTIWFHAEAEEF